MKSIFSKVFLGFVVSIILFMSVVIIFSAGVIRDYYTDAQIADIQKLNRTIIYEVEPLLSGNKQDSLERAIKDLARINNIRITIIAPDGVVLHDTEKDPKTMENHGDRPEIISAGRKGTGDTVRYSYSIRTGLLYDAVAVRDSRGEIIAYSRLSVPVSSVDEMVSGLTWQVVILAIVGIIVATIIIFFFVRSLTYPIKTLAFHANQVAQGDFKARVYLNRRDELASLANSLNSMAMKLSRLFDENFRQSEKLKSIFSSIKDGIIVIDNKDRIVFTNEQLQTIVRADPDYKKYYWEIIPDPQFSKLVRKIQNTGRPLSKDVVINKGNYTASGSITNGDREVVVMLRNIDEMKRIEVIKKEFIANVSHELKTPLTSIKGFIETMELEADPSNRHYLCIMKRQADRLINIVQDIVLLAQVEHTDRELLVSDVDLNDVLMVALKILSPKIEAKNLEVNINIAGDAAVIKADEYMMEQVFLNLLENAVNYTEEGFIGFRTFRLNDNIILEFSDSGIGIPENQTERIFERFYTVDRSRSRSLSGTGLGLSIVKHIVMSHGGSIICKSSPGAGSVFKITLPVNK